MPHESDQLVKQVQRRAIAGSICRSQDFRFAGQVHGANLRKIRFCFT
jgi:hypothetical protein